MRTTTFAVETEAPLIVDQVLAQDGKTLATFQKGRAQIIPDMHGAQVAGGTPRS